MNQHHPAPIISPQSPLIFMHIPKSGGMSLFASLSKVLENPIADLYNHSRQTLMNAPLLMQDTTKAAYCGHFSIGLHQWLSRPSYYVSFVREPVSRLLSLYFFLLEHWPEMHARLTRLSIAGKKTLPEFHLDFADWFIAKTAREENFLTSPSAELDNGMVRRFSGYGLNPAPCPNVALAKAIENIEKYFSFVGLVERYSESIDLMATLFGLPGLKENHVNRTGKKSRENHGLSTAAVSKIRKMNQLDQALYNWVSNNFDSRKNNLRPIGIMGFGRRDYQSMPLWKGVGGGRAKALKAAG